MALSEEAVDSSLWDASVTGNKSWVELAEEEDEEFRKLNQRESSKTVAGKLSLSIVKKEEGECDTTLEEDKSTTEISLDIKKAPGKDPPTSTFPVISFDLSRVKTEVSETKPELPKPELPHEELSLTGHLSDFRLVSPCKVEPTDKRLFKDCANINDTPKTPESKVNKRKIDDVKGPIKLSDELLMPSPSKISRSSPVTPKTPRSQPKRTKRPRESSGQTPSSAGKPRTPVERETDPDVLARRQKQIDYGKNTIGYDRYVQLVPKDARKTRHPKTPPMHLKFSRRAWDGLIRSWRQRLHFWDPPSEGGGNPELLEDGISDLSSTEGSLPCTPVQDWKRQRFSRLKGDVNEQEVEDDDDDEEELGRPLTDFD